jgi:hypothetical protein
VLDYLLLEITTPLIVYICRRHGGTCKVGFEFYLRIECILLKFHWSMKALTEVHYRASLKMYFGQRFHTPMKLQKNVFNSYNYIQITPKFNIVEFFVVNFICVRLFAVGNYYAIDCLHLTSSWRHVQVRI